MNKKLKKIIRVILIVCLIFVLTHLTPYNALRTHIFFMGHPIMAFTTSFEEDIVHKELEKKNIKFYTTNNPPIDYQTRNEKTSYIVTKKFFLFFAKYYGEA